jgi:hypothetical protein
MTILKKEIKERKTFMGESFELGRTKRLKQEQQQENFLRLSLRSAERDLPRQFPREEEH